MADGREGGPNRMSAEDTLPMLAGEVQECHELLAVFLQLQRCFGAFGCIGFDEQNEHLFHISLGRGLSGVEDYDLGFWL